MESQGLVCPQTLSAPGTVLSLTCLAHSGSLIGWSCEYYDAANEADPLVRHLLRLQDPCPLARVGLCGNMESQISVVQPTQHRKPSLPLLRSAAPSPILARDSPTCPPVQKSRVFQRLPEVSSCHSSPQGGVHLNCHLPSGHW